MQAGVGLLEVLLALLLLSISVFGYAALQLRAMYAAQEAGHYIDAVNLAKDLAERMRVNPQGAMQNSALSTTSKGTSCTATQPCSASAMAVDDFNQVSQKAQALAMRIAVLPCQNSRTKRQCIYVAWRQSKVAQNEEMTNCTQAAVYQPQRRCLVLEAYANGQ